MHFTHLVDQVSRLTGLPKTKVAAVLQTFSEVVKSNVWSGESVKIPRLGTFYAGELKQRPLFGGTRKVSRSQTIRFRKSRRA